MPFLLCRHVPRLGVPAPPDDDLDDSHLPLCDDHVFNQLISLAGVRCGRCGRETSISFVVCSWCSLELQQCAFDGRPMTRIGKPPETTT